MNLPGRVVLLISAGVAVLLIAVAFYWQLETRHAAAPAPAPPGEQGAPETPALARTPTDTTEGNQREVTLFFRSPSSDSLARETRKIFLTETVTDQARQVVRELIDGPHTDLVPTCPAKTEVREVYLDAKGTAYVDFSRALVDDHPGGSAAEIDTIFSLVDTLTYNFPEIRRVKILVEGEERETLKGHLDLNRAYVADMSLVESDRER